MKLTLPEGFQLPATAKPGEPFESVATLLMHEDGSVEVTALDGVALPEEEESEEQEMMEPEQEMMEPDITIPFEKR